MFLWILYLKEMWMWFISSGNSWELYFMIVILINIAKGHVEWFKAIFVSVCVAKSFKQLSMLFYYEW